MRSYKIHALVLLAVFLVKCEKDNLNQKNDNELFTPYLTSVRNDEEVTLKWTKPGCLYCGGCECYTLDPICFEVMISYSGPTELTKYLTVQNNIFEVTIDNLTNGVPYYFVVRGVGLNGQYRESNTIMVIPDNPENLHQIFEHVDKYTGFGTFSRNESFIAYESDYTWNNGNNSARSVFLADLSDKSEWLVEKNSYSPEWSPVENKIVYQSDNGEVQPWYGYTPTHIIVYNMVDSSFTKLTDGNSFNFLPTWSSDGNWIAFLSDKVGGNEYNLWKVPASGGAAVKLTSDFNDLNDLAMITDKSLRKPSWSPDGEEIAFSRIEMLNSYVFNIFSVPSSGGSLDTIISSQWNDYAPAFSPDGLEIAFISDRSGSNEIWSMNLQTKKLRQITGSYEKWVYDSWLDWSESGDKILFTGTSDDFYTLFTVDVNY